jgi:hypothetical protein
MSESSAKSVEVETSMVQQYAEFIQDAPELRKAVTFQEAKNLPIHGWFKYTQGFSPSLLEHYHKKWDMGEGTKLIDPFVGSGTSLVYAQNVGWEAMGWDLSPLAVFLSQAKTSSLRANPQDIIESILGRMPNSAEIHQYELPTQILKLADRAFPKNVWRDILRVRYALDAHDVEKWHSLAVVCMLSSLEEASYIRKHGSHYRFMNSDNAGVQRELNFEGINFLEIFTDKLTKFVTQASDIRLNKVVAKLGDARTMTTDYRATHVITSPPYLNRNNYIAQSKLELFLGGMLETFDEYRNLTRSTLRSHVEAISPSEERSLDCHRVKSICELVEKRGVSYKGVVEMIEGYFTDMHQVLENLSQCTEVGAKIALVVGCSRWSGVVVPTDLLIAEHALSTGKYRLVSVDVTRYKGNAPQQMKKWGRIPVRESVVQLERIE